MDTHQGADERRMRHLMLRRGVGPDATVPAEPDWFDRLYADEQDSESPAAPAPDAPEPVGEQRWWQAQPGYYPQVHAPALPVAKVEAALSPRTRAALYNATAAGAGWAVRLEPQIARAINECGEQVGMAGALVLGCGICLLVAHVWDRRTRHWWIGLAWAARIPLASALIALALYAPGATF